MKILIYFLLVVKCIFTFPGSDYKEPASVKKFFPVTPVILTTPALNADRSTFTTQREMLDYLGAIHTSNNCTVVNLLGPTKDKNYLPAFVLSRGKELTFKNTRNNKPTVMLIAQQHGDEPMSCDILMGTLKRIAKSDMNYLLDRINIVIMPRINPDGAAKFTRVNASKIDINDDHQKNYTIEASAVRNIYDLFLPEVFIDFHEYIADAESYEGVLPGGAVPYFDILTLYPTNPNYPIALRREAMATVEKFKRELPKEGYTTDLYYNPFKKPKNGTPFTIYRATSDSGLARNAYGLLGSLSYLIETRGRGIGFENVERRLNSGLRSVEIFLEETYLKSDYIKKLVQENRGSISNSNKIKLAQENIQLQLIDSSVGSLVKTPALLIKQDINN